MSQSSGKTGTRENPPFESDRFIHGEIDKLRRKLLDLTTRNPLLSFKHGGRSRRHLRVIDELPDQLYSRLNAETVMRLRSLGEEESEPADERTIFFQRALDAAKLDDPEYLQKLRELGDDPGDKALERIEQDLRSRLRERLGMPPRRSNAGASIADVARRKGLDPSFDLPSTATGSHHADTIMQTLLFSEAMERTLAGIREHVRLSIDESGVNPLFCVFGFLEWYEDTNSQTSLHAPLLLYPLEIDRELVRGHYQYTIRSTGEGAMVNVALAERLKRDFEIILPPFEEESTPETYFAQVQKVIEHERAWKLRRWVTIGLFSFARIAM